MKSILEYFVKELVDDKENVSIEMDEGDEIITLKIHVSDKDRGAVIGIHGRRIKALKEVVHMEGFKTGKKVRLEVV